MKLAEECMLEMGAAKMMLAAKESLRKLLLAYAKCGTNQFNLSNYFTGDLGLAFTLPPEQYQAVLDWLRDEGFKITLMPPYTLVEWDRP
jgi:hypothetical protein